MPVIVKHVIDRPALARLLRDPAVGVTRDISRRGKNVERVAKTLVGADKGRLRNSIKSRMRRRPVPTARVGSGLKYAVWHHEGTGIYGPHGQPIRPVRAKVMVFTPKGSSKKVFARSVRGQRGTKYLKRALPAAKL